MPRRPHAPRARARRILGIQTKARALRIICALAALLVATASPAAPPAAQGTSARAARDEALRSIPMSKLATEDKARITATVSGTSIFRRLPVQVTQCDPDLYLFLIRHPEVVVNIWEVMNVSNVAMARTSENSFRASDGAGTLCNVKYCYSDHETQVIYAEGSYDGPLFNRPVRASCVLVLKSGYVRETNGKYYVTSRMDTFVQIEHAGVELLAKTLQPLVHRSADYNFTETAAFVGTVSKAAETNAAGVNRLARRLTNLDPATRERFAQLASEVGRKAQQRDGAIGALPQTAPKQNLVERR
jgi:hypothetical protein